MYVILALNLLLVSRISRARLPHLCHNFTNVITSVASINCFRTKQKILFFDIAVYPILFLMTVLMLSLLRNIIARDAIRNRYWIENSLIESCVFSLNQESEGLLGFGPFDYTEKPIILRIYPN